jgi:hypothetical protein
LIENYREERALQYPMANIIESKQEVPPTSNKVISEK